MSPTASPSITRPVVEILGRHTGYGFAGIGVSTAIGNFTQTTRDLGFGAGLLRLLDWRRTYNSHSGAVGALGPGWSTSFSARLVPGSSHSLLRSASRQVTFYDEDGRVLTFVASGDASFTSPQDLAATLTSNADGSFALTYNSGEIWSFDPTGRLTARSREGQQVALSYDANDLLVSAVHTTGRQLTFGYDANRRLTAVTANDGRVAAFGYGPGTVTDSLLQTVTVPGGGVFSFEYSGSGQASQVAKITSPDGNLMVANSYDARTSQVTGQQFPGGGGATFGYDSGGTTTVTMTPTGANTVFQANADGRIAKLTDAAEHVSTFSYDAQGYLAQAVTPGGTVLTQRRDASGNLLTSEFGGATTAWAYDSLHRVTAITSPVGGTTSLAYSGTSHIPAQVIDPNGGVTTISSEAGLLTGWTNADGSTTQYGYNAASDLTSITNPAGNVIGLSHDPTGQVTGLVAPSGAAYQWVRDAAGLVTTYTGPDGGVTQFGYSPAGLLLQQTSPGGITTGYGYDAAGNRTSVTDGLGRQITFGFDALGNQTSAADPDGNITKFGYNDLGQLTSVTNAAGMVTQFGYDADGNNVTTTTPAGTITAGYDERGNNTSATDATGATVHFGFDAADRVTSVTNAIGGTWQLGYDAGGNVVSVTDATGESARFAWTAAAQLESCTDPLGRTTSVTRDAAGQVTAVTDAMGGVTKFSYDADGRQTAQESPAGLQTSYDHDQLGRIVTTTSPTGWVTRTVYDARGQRVAVISPSGLVTRYDYDAAGQLTEVIDGNGSTTRYGYDAAGRVVMVTDPKGAVTRYGYDGEGRLTSRTDPLGRTTQRQYDTSGNLVAITDPSGRVQHMAYDADGRLVEQSADGTQTVSYTYDQAGRRASMTDATGTTTYTYDANGRLLTTTDPDGKVIKAGYDAAGQLTSLSYPDGLTLGYSYDQNGRLIGLTDSRAGDAVYVLDADGGLLTEQLPGRLARRYEYDGGLLSRFRVFRDGVPVAETVLGRDPDGRVIAERDGEDVREYRYDRAGQLVGVERREAGRHRQLHLTYDAAGNRTSMRDDGVVTHYAHDAADQLTSLQTGERRVELRYDSSGRLIEQVDGERRRLISYNGFGLPVIVSLAEHGTRETASNTFDGDGLLAEMVVTNKNEERDEQRAASIRYRWSSGSEIPQVLTQLAAPALDDAEHDRGDRLDADFSYGYGRTFGSSAHSAAAFHRDSYGSSIRTEETEDWAQARGYDAFGVPDERARGREAERRDAERRDAERRHAAARHPDHGPAPAEPELPRFGYRGELALGPMIDLRARAYDAELGRFTTCDPLAFEAPTPGEPVNPYAYAYNDPVNYTDPLGAVAVAPIGGSGAVSSLVPVAPASPHPSSGTAVLTSAVTSTALTLNYTPTHNLASRVGAVTLAAQLYPQFGVPIEVHFDYTVKGGTKELMTIPPQIPPAWEEAGYIDVLFVYSNAGAANEYKIWETKSVTTDANLVPLNENYRANLAYDEATWYSYVLAARMAEQFTPIVAGPGEPMATPAFVPIPIGFGFTGGPGWLMVYSNAGNYRGFGAILYRTVRGIRIPQLQYRYNPATQTLVALNARSLSPGQIGAQRAVLDAAEWTLVVAGVGAAAVGTAALIAEILSWIARFAFVGA
jgi:RHS repeat-associated protein